MLTPKQSKFVEEFLVDLNGAKAAVRAGYSNKFANRQASQLLANAEVAAAIDKAKSQRSIEVGVDQRYVLKALVEKCEADIKHLFDPVTKDLLPVDEWPPVFRMGLVQSVEIDALFDGSGRDRRQVGHSKKIRLADRTRILELIGKHVKVNAFQENVHHRGLDGLGDRLDRAFAREHENAFKREADSAPVIDITPLGDGDSAEALDLADEAAEGEQQKPALPPAAEPEPAAPPPPPRYEPIWPAEQEFVQSDYDVSGYDDAPYRNR